MFPSVNSSAQEWIERGEEALRQADWPKARECFAAALQHEKIASAHDGLGQALWWLNEIEEAHKQRAAAYLAYKQHGEWGEKTPCRPIAAPGFCLFSPPVIIHPLTILR